MERDKLALLEIISRIERELKNLKEFRGDRIDRLAERFESVSGWPYLLLDFRAAFTSFSTLV